MLEGSQFRELIHRVRDRDPEAAQELVRRYENVIRRVVRIHLRDARLRRVLDSMDICQSVLASFFVRTALGQYEIDSPEQLLNLLTAITRNKLTNQANRLRAQRRDQRREAAGGAAVDNLIDQASDPSDQASAKEILEKVRGRLDEQEGYLAEQRSLGRSWKELADELGGTDVALRKKLTRALNRVMTGLGLGEDDDALTMQHLLDSLLDKQKQSWRAGHRPAVEELLQGSGLQHDAEALLDLIYHEIVVREELGEHPSAAEYLRRYPDLREDIELHFEVHRAVQEHLLIETDWRQEEDSLPDREVAALEPMPELPDYELAGQLGQGGMGIVYKARHRRLRRYVALKMFQPGRLPSPGEVTRFQTEAEAIARLQHPNIVQIFEIGQCKGLPYLALELAEQGTLAEKLQQFPFGPRAAAELIETLARAMHYAHEQHILHRDLKPANVLFTQEGIPKITDFGLAKILEEETESPRDATVTGEPLGTPRYMAPEQACGRLDQIGPATDVYALGTMLYECLTGQVPFMATSVMETLLKIRAQEPLVPRRLQPSIPRDLQTICLNCLHKEPGRRYASALALAEDLRCFLSHQPIQARPVAVWERLWKWGRRHPAFAGLVAVTVLSLFVLLMLRLWHSVELLATEKQARTDEHREQLAHLQKDRDHYQQFLQQRDDALFHGIRGMLFPAAKAPRKSEAIRKAVQQTLSLVSLDVEAGSGPVFDPYWTDQEKSEVKTGCFQLLLILADAVAQPTPGQTPEDQRQQHLRALHLLDRADTLIPETRAYHLRRRRLLWQQRDEIGAARELERSTAVEPTTMIDFFLIGDERYKQGVVQVGDERSKQEVFQEASRNFQNALRLQPKDFWSQYFLAACHLKLGRPVEAKDCLTRCLEQRPKFLWAYLLRGVAHEQANAFEDAERDFRAALQLDVDDDARYVVYVTRGLLRFRQRQLQNAAADLEQAIALQPDRYYAHVSLARIYQSQKRWEQSSTQFDRASRLQPPPQIAAECQAERSRNLYFSKRYQDALHAADVALKIFPKYVDGHQRRAFALLGLQRFEDAAQAFDDYFAHNGKADADFYRGRGRARMQLGDFLAAKDDYTRGLELEPGPDLFLHRGWAYFFADAWKPALHDFDEALRRDPKTPDAHIGRGLARVMLGHNAEAVADAEAALGRPPTAPEMMHNLACIFALAAGKVANNPADKQRQLLASRYRDQALEVVRRTLALVPPEERQRFWRNKILPDQALGSLHDHPEFKMLERQYSAVPQASLSPIGDLDHVGVGAFA